MSDVFSATVSTEYYPKADPFPYAKLDGLGIVEDALLEALADQLPPARSPDWIRYDTPLERKLMLESPPPALAEICERLNSPEWLEFVSEMTEIPGLVADGSLYGAGLSVVGPGGHLCLHKDLEIHPKTGLERRVNLILFTNQEWQDEWGGHLEFWSSCGAYPKECRRRLRPTRGRILLFDPQGYHGYPDPISCPPDVQRLSVQLFYYAKAREGKSRTKAWFSRRPTDDCDAILNALRASRTV